MKEIKRSKDFRIIGCMNPGTDIGKKELPPNVRSKFTEIYVHEISEKNDLMVKKKMWILRKFW